MYYIYLHIKQDTGEPFYVGKGKGKRCVVERMRSVHWHNISKKHGYDVIFLEENLSEKKAFEKERYWIKRLGRIDLGTGVLCNFTNGGEGTSGRPMSEKTKRIISETNKKRISSESHKKSVASIYKGKFGFQHNRSKSVVCIETGVVYGSQSEAQRKLNLSNGSVSWSIKYKKPIFGMHFEIKN